MSRTYTPRTCHVCGATVSSNGAAWSAHERKHLRTGELVLVAHAGLPDRRPEAVTPAKAERLIEKEGSWYVVVKP